MNIKTFKEWQELKIHIDEYMIEGDFVDINMVMHFSNKPDSIILDGFIQSESYLGFDENYMHDRSYRTFVKIDDNWKFVGWCFANESDTSKIKGFTLEPGPPDYLWKSGKREN